ncbi:MAG: hypothetical protein IKS83_01025 [Victivallales bacterium]|nr:hypothetical protein [Victivallales bacterium]
MLNVPRDLAIFELGEAQHLNVSVKHATRQKAASTTKAAISPYEKALHRKPRVQKGPSGPMLQDGPSGPMLQDGPSGPMLQDGPSGPMLQDGPSGPMFGGDY